MELVGRGAMAEVWADPSRPGSVWKTPRAEQRDNPVFAHQLRVEAEAMRRVDHPAVLRLHGEEPGGLWLERGAPAGAPSASERLAWIDRLADGLAALHAAGVVHRDVKGANVLRVERGVVLADLGCGRIDGWPDPAPALGSPEAMSPGRLSGRPAEPADDRWALAVLLWTWCAGAPPFPARWHDVVRAQAAGFPPPPPLATAPERERLAAWTR